MADTYNDTFLGNADVPKTGTFNPPSTPPSPPKTQNTIPANVKTDGTANLRAETQTKMAAVHTTPSGGKDQRPDIQTYEDGTV